MKRSPKREAEEPGHGSREREADESSQQSQQGTTDRRILRSQYFSLISKINDAKNDYTDSEKFSRFLNEVESLHQLVHTPREQVADAEALFDLTNTLLSSIKSQVADGFSPTDFINSLINGFGKPSSGIDAAENPQASISWKEIGLFVCSMFRVSHGCSTMLGPMDTDLKQRKRAMVNRKHTRVADGVQPEEVDEAQAEEKTDTDKNMVTMFNILRRNKRIRLENLILNRRSFAQTTENLFALSFLVKDGRVEIVADERGSHFVLPRNAPAALSVTSGEVVYNHFVFRYDFQDLKLMSQMVPAADELMPQRGTSFISSAGQPEPVAPSQDSQQEPPATPIRKLSRNYSRRFT